LLGDVHADLDPRLGGAASGATDPSLRAELDQLKAAQRDRSPQGSSDAPKPW